MRRLAPVLRPAPAVSLATASGALILSVAVGVAVAPAAIAAPTPAATPAPATQTVSYDGYSTSVPASWPVYDLSRNPSTCVRFDVHAVYLGHPGPDQQCPAHAVGHTEALLIEPNDAQAATHVQPTSDGVVQAISATHQTLITASYGADQAAAQAVLARGSALSKTTPMPDAPTSTAAPTTADPAVLTTQSLGFDTCAAPSAATMSAWRASPYRTIGVYIGGINRACGYGNLSTSWMTSVHSYGFTTIPIYVGPQAPCSGVGQPMPTPPADAAAAATNNAYGAVLDMQGLGMGAGNPVYLDVEQYDGSAACHAAVVAYVSAWTAELHALGYVAGFYSSNMHDLVSNYNVASFHRPDAVWIARWNGIQTVYGDPVVPDSYWNPHRRLHQFSGGGVHTYGGASINIDGDAVDGPVGAPGAQNGPPPGLPLNSTDLGGSLVLGPGAASASGTSLATVVRGLSNRMFIRTAAGGLWSATWQLPFNTVITGNPAAVSWGAGDVHAFARGQDGHLIQFWQGGGRWTGQQDFGICIAGGPAVASTGPGSIDLVIRGCDNYIYLTTYSVAGGWTGWLPLGGRATSDPSVAVWFGHIEVFVQTTGGKIAHRWRDGSTWWPWVPLTNGNTTIGGPAVVARGALLMDLYVRDTSGALEYMRHAPGVDWTPPQPLGIAATSDVDVAALGAHRDDIFFRGTAGECEHRWFAR